MAPVSLQIGAFLFLKFNLIINKMAQRNIDSNFYNTHFVRGLPGPYKSLWAWLQLNCDHAGIWEIDIDVARMRTGFFDIETEKAAQLFEAKILVLSCGEKWFLKEYPADQFKTIELNPCNTYHWGAIVILQRLALMDNDFIVKNQQMPQACKPLYSSSKDAKRNNIKYLVSNIKDLDKNKDAQKENLTDEDKTTSVPKQPKQPKKEQPTTFLTPLVQAFRDFKEMRVKMRKPMTERAVQMIHTELTKLAGNDEALKILILEQSTRKGWLDVFALKNDFQQKPAGNQQNKAQQIINQAAAAQYTGE